MGRDNSTETIRGAPVPRRVAILAVGLVLAALIGTFVASVIAGAPNSLPGVALGSPLMLHAVRAFIVAGLIGGTAVAILRLWRGELPTKVSTTAVEWAASSDSAALREVQEQLLHVERESKAAIDELAALVRPLLPSPEDSVLVDNALNRWEGALSKAETTDALAEAISALPERQKLVVALTYYENLSTEEVAEILGVARTSVVRLRHEALERLRDRLGGEPFPEANKGGERS